MTTCGGLTEAKRIVNSPALAGPSCARELVHSDLGAATVHFALLADHAVHRVRTAEVYDSPLGRELPCRGLSRA